MWLKNCKKISRQYLHDTTLWWRKYDVIEKRHFCKKKNAAIHSACSVASKFAGFKSIWLKCVGNTAIQGYKTCMTDLDDLKHRIRTEWTKLDHAVIASSVLHQWLMTLSLQRQCCISGAVVSQGASRPATVISSTVFGSDIVFSVITMTFLTVVDQSNTCTQIAIYRPIWFNCSCQLWFCALQ